jgi:hypothetical protein
MAIRAMPSSICFSSDSTVPFEVDEHDAADLRIACHDH